ncbi:hypothetical protein GJ744_001725 [Endocarpon pusillum]|uniref:Protein kinase domain-containing protein n=1 Tax=Endocarpon pusillum TaxID=364733 RepID=A0A8H7E0E7_9EURO|nr:hypothetical protein GJ744_001725 [Endocarpon pusillum]
MVDPVGTSLAVFATVDLCVKYGKQLLGKYQSFKDADRDIRELVLCVENHWIKFEYQIRFLRGVWNNLDERLQVHQHHLLHTLQIKLQEANNTIGSAIGTQIQSSTAESVFKKSGSIHKGKYALYLKDCIKRSVDDLQKWHDMFDPSWFLINRVSSPNIDDQLSDEFVKDNESVLILKELREAVRASQSYSVSVGEGSIWLAPDFIMAQRERVLFSDVQVARAQNGSQSILVDTVILDAQAQLAATTKDIRDLARILSKSDPKCFGLLRCAGVIKQVQPLDQIESAKFELLFTVPDGLRAPTSLRTVLRMSEDIYSLNERICLARSLASSVMYIHSSKFVHKNIRPETTILFTNDESQLAAAFLLGFQKFRPITGWTFRRGDSLWERDLYRHPSRQGLQPEEDYMMQHDIYSLGVLLLEIGLWTSFIEQDSSGRSIPGPVLHIGGILNEPRERKKAAAIKSTLVELASAKLASKMGHKYSSTVLACLTCLDKTNNDFGDEDEFLDEDGIVVGVRYIEKVLLRIHEISV